MTGWQLDMLLRSSRPIQETAILYMPPVGHTEAVSAKPLAYLSPAHRDRFLIPAPRTAPVASRPNPHSFAIHSAANPSTPHHERPHRIARHRPNHHTPFSFPPFSFPTSTLLDFLFLPRPLKPDAPPTAPISPKPAHLYNTALEKMLYRCI
jgi:hypothetical protein